MLISNASVAGWGTRLVTEDGLEAATFAMNHLAPFLLTNLLLDMFKASAPSRVVTVSSAAHRNVTLILDDPQGERRNSGFGAYSRSKLANILFTQELSRRLEGTSVTANCLHPGVVATGIFRNLARWIGFIMASPLVLSPERGADTTICLATAPELVEISGQYFVRRKLVRSSRASCDAETALHCGGRARC